MTPAQQRYREYLKSDHWRRTRRRILDRAEEHCECCGYFCGQVEMLEPSILSDRIYEMDGGGYEPCRVCGFFCQFRSTDDRSGRVWLEVHHLTYERVGRERDDDLIALCYYCHEDVTEREQFRALIKHNMAPDLPRDATQLEVFAAVFAFWDEKDRAKGGA
jgi:hypothetical protein